MFKIHLKIFWRQLQRNIFYVVINVLGLSFATTLSMFIFIHCWHELTYDKFHKNYKNIYLLKMDYLSNNEVIFNMYPPTPIYEALNQQFSEVEYASRVYVSKNMILNINSENYDVGNLLTIDPMFFDMFSYKLQQGQSKSIFSNSKEIIISTHIAKKYFNNENAIGKTVVLQGYGEYLITGVIEVPSNSSLQFDFIKSTQPSDQITWKFGVVAPIYFTSKSIRQVEQTVQILQTSINDHYGEGNFKLEAVPLSEQYFNSKIDFSLHGSIQYVWIFISLGIGILSLSILNYINLTLPQAFKRSKDVGIRTIVGANRLQLILQIIFETLILIILSIFLSLVFITILTPTFKSLIGKEISLDVFQLNELVVFGLLFTTILISSCGIYPALHLNKYFANSCS